VSVFGLGDVSTLAKDEIARIVGEQVDTTDSCTDPETGWACDLIKAYADREQQTLKAYGFRFRGLGFWAPIEGILAVTPDLEKTVGLVILDQKETPGLGGRIAEPVFLDQFADGLDVSVPAGDAPFLVVSGSPSEPGSAGAGRHVDAITGATQTSMAMDRILNDALRKFTRAMQSRRTTRMFRDADGPTG